MYDLHLGMTLATFAVWERGTDLPVGTDLDGWNAWGESLGADVNDDETIHVIVQSESQLILTALAAYLTDEHREDLVPMSGYEQQEGVLAVITTTDDWSVVLEQTNA